MFFGLNFSGQLAIPVGMDTPNSWRNPFRSPPESSLPRMWAAVPDLIGEILRDTPRG